MKSLFHDSNNRIESSFRFEAKSEMNSVLDVHEFNKIQKKGKPKNSVNKKDLMTKTEKKAIKFTKRDSSDFEIIEQALE